MDIKKVKNTTALIEQFKMTQGNFTRVPIEINGKLYLISKEAKYCDEMAVFKAIVNGISIDTSPKREVQLVLDI